MSRDKHIRLGLIGYGAIAHEIAQKVSDIGSIEIVGALVLPEDQSKTAAFPLVTTWRELSAFNPNLVAECASHDAVDSHAEAILAANIDLMIVSIGALADQALEQKIRRAAEKSGGQVILPAGAMIGIDGLAAARRVGLDQVVLTSSKPPLAWSGAPGSKKINLQEIDQETVIFSGTARQAARQFPKNANVAATIALAGIGFDRTQVTLIADPKAQGNRHVLEFSGAAGSYLVQTDGVVSPDNPKTSMLTAYSILRAIENRTSAIII